MSAAICTLPAKAKFKASRLKVVLAYLIARPRLCPNPGKCGWDCAAASVGPLRSEGPALRSACVVQLKHGVLLTCPDIVTPNALGLSS